MKSISELDSNLTIVMIAHRLSTLEYCDKVIKLDSGEITFSGSYKNLNRI